MRTRKASAKSNELIAGPLLYEYANGCGRKIARRNAKSGKRKGCGQEEQAKSRVRIGFRPYQLPVFRDRSSGILILHWSRQIGKSFTLAAWAVDRLLTRPGRLVTVLSNSRENGAEFVAKCAEVCRLNGTEYTSVDKSRGLRFQNMRMEVRIRAQGKTGRIKVLAANPRTARGFSGDLILDEFAFHEDSNAIWEAAEPILASNPDFLCRMASTGNGRHNLFYRMTTGAEDTFRWEGTEEIYDPASGTGLRCTTGASNQQANGLDKISAVGGEGEKIEDDPPSLRSFGAPRDEQEKETGTESPSPRPLPIGWGEGEEPECRGVLTGSGVSRSRAGYAVSRITRTQAWRTGVKIYDANTREVVTPEEARTQALDKRAYDQNYECVFADENATLLSHELINAAEVFPDGHPVGVICEQDWGNALVVPSRMRDGLVGGFKDRLKPGLQTPNRPACGTGLRTLDLLRNAVGPLFVGFDVARKGDLSVITVIEDLNGLKMVRAILRMRDLRLPEQQQRLGEICRLPKFRRAAIDMTGLGLGLFEYAQEEFGASRIHGINFATSVPATRAVRLGGRKRETVRVTEAMAMELLQVYEDRRIQHPADNRLRDDLRKPEKITTPGGRVSIAATRDEAGHADHFWSFALALEAASHGGGSGAVQLVERQRRYLL